MAQSKPLNITGKVNNGVQKVEYYPYDSDTAKVTINQKDRTIKVDVVGPNIFPVEVKERKEADNQIKFGPKTITKSIEECDYLYEVDYTDLDYEYAKEKEMYIVPTGACSAIYKKIGDEVYFARSFDWFYDKTCTYKFHVNRGLDPKGNIRYESWGIAGGSIDLSTDDFNKKDIKNNKELRLIPFFALDGINENGVVCNNNVVHCYYPDKHIIKTTPTISEEYEISMHCLPRFILDRAQNANDICDYIIEHVSLTCPQNLRDANYICHFLIGDKDNCFLLEVDTETNTIIKTVQDKMFNFEERNLVPNENGTVYCPETLDDQHKPTIINKIDKFGAGLERWNIAATKEINDAHDLWDLIHDDLNYRRTYGCEPNSQEAFADNVNWWSEYTGVYGEKEFTVDTPMQEYKDVNAHGLAAEQFNNRDREKGGPTWHSTHTSLYNLTEKTLRVTVQSHEREEGEAHFILQNSQSSTESLDRRISEEINRAKTEEQLLDQKIDNAIESAISEIERIDTTLNAEVIRATEAEKTLRDELSVTWEELNRKIDDSIELEKQERITKDADLQNQLNDVNNALLLEKTNRINSDDQINSQLTSEISRSTEADETLRNELESEVERAQAKESELESAIEAEETRAKGVEADLAEDISKVASDLATEIADREDGDESTLSTAKSYANDLVLAEEERATSAETALGDRIKAIEDAPYATEKYVTDAVDAEASSRSDADIALSDRIRALESRGRYLSGWNMTTGLPDTNPDEIPYTYKSGDYYLVSVVPETGNRYKPHGTQYEGIPSTAIELDLEVTIGDEYLYDTNQWILIKSALRTVTFAQITGEVTDNENLSSAFNEKQDKLPDEDEDKNKFLYKDTTGNLSWQSVEVPVNDVQVNGTSVVDEDGIANINTDQFNVKTVTKTESYIDITIDTNETVTYTNTITSTAEHPNVIITLSDDFGQGKLADINFNTSSNLSTPLLGIQVIGNNYEVVKYGRKFTDIRECNISLNADVSIIIEGIGNNRRILIYEIV